MVNIARMSVGAVAAAALVGAALSGCSAKVETSTSKSVSAADLQKQLTDKFAGSATPPKSVTCTQDLAAEVGKTATCDVALNDSDSVEAVVTVTKVEGTGVDFDIAPALTKAQLEKSLAGSTPGTVTCESGLQGAVGATAKCENTLDGVVTKRVVQVDGVSGLQMDVSAKRLLPKDQVGQVLLQKLNADGTPAETVDCVDDVEAKQGTVVECAAVTGDQKKGYQVTVTTVDEKTFDIDYKDAP